jgi:hypothetical protein
MARQRLVAEFSDADAVLEAVRRLRARGTRIDEVFSPYPVHGLDQAMGLRRSRLPLVTLAGGAFGAASALAMQFYMAVFDWPLNVGGKPPNSTLAFVPITFELTVLCAGLLTAAAFLVRSRLAPGAQASPLAGGATEDTFMLVLRGPDNTSEADEARRLLVESGAVRVQEIRA